MRRFTRLTNAFSKEVENHAAAVPLYFMYYNFGRVHQTLRVTPAMEAGVANHVWSVEESEPAGCTVRMEALMEPQGGAYVEGFAIQVGSVWVAIPILVAVVFGLWKLGKIIWAAISN